MNTNRIIRKAQADEIQTIMSMCNHSRSFMRANGNTTQWVNGYPSAATIELDIVNGNGYIVEENNKAIGYFAFIIGPDPTYSIIENGSWLDDATPYGTVHRLACAPGYHGVAKSCFEWCQTQAACVRADTHADNHIMQHIMTGLGFCRCGVIYVADGTPRDAYQKMTYPMVDSNLKSYIENEILPQYSHFDSAHRLDHVQYVMAQSLELAQHYPQLNNNMVYAIAAYHDTGLSEGRERHHLVSGQLVRKDANLQKWFSSDEIETMAQAVEDHRASALSAPRSLYGMVVAEADRDIEPMKIVRRTVQYGLTHYPTLDNEAQWHRCVGHLEEKYAEGGYLKLLIPYSRNKGQLEKLWALIADKKALRRVYDEIIEAENIPNNKIQ